MRRDSSDGDDLAAEDYSDETSTFGDRLVLAREAMGMGRAQLAHRLGLKLQTLKNWEEDRSEPRANRLQMLAGTLGVSMVWLMSGQGEAPRVAAEPGPDGDAARACLADLRALRTQQMQIVERMARIEKRLRAVLG